eukprot:GHVR01054738.1.p1 GENE.GHVR01054738.1~~GHVR01054738.1.p1  ORF type:complete len:209 (-),score=87.62 GHVR01054738.1:58-660(-)
MSIDVYTRVSCRTIPCIFGCIFGVASIADTLFGGVCLVSCLLKYNDRDINMISNMNQLQRKYINYDPMILQTEYIINMCIIGGVMCVVGLFFFILMPITLLSGRRKCEVSFEDVALIEAMPTHTQWIKMITLESQRAKEIKDKINNDIINDDKNTHTHTTQARGKNQPNDHTQTHTHTHTNTHTTVTPKAEEQDEVVENK